MPIVTIPIGPVSENSDISVLENESSRIVDAYVGDKGELVKRPGVVYDDGTNNPLYIGSATDPPILGLFWWPHAQVVIGKSARKLWYISLPTGSVRLQVTEAGTVDTIGTYGVTPRPSFAAASDYCYVASGNLITRSSSGGSTPAMSDPDTPTNVTHVALLDGYLLASVWNSATFYWSDANSPSVWTATNFASALGDSDYISAMHVLNRQIYFFGPVSIEIWENNGITPFERIPGGFIQTGTSAPYTIIEVDGEFYFFDQKRRFVKLAGRGIEQIPCPYSDSIQAASSVDNASGYRMVLGNRDLLVFNFPSMGRTFVYNLFNKTWSEFGRWREEASIYEPFLANAYCYAVDWNKHLACTTRNSQIYLLDKSYYVDTSTASGSPANTEVIRTSWVSGNIDHGTGRNKRSQEIRFRVRKGALSSTESKMMIRWRDNNRPQWSNWHEVSLGNTGESDCIARLYRTGIYRTRQWEIAMTDAVPFALSKIEEEVDFLR